MNVGLSRRSAKPFWSQASESSILSLTAILPCLEASTSICCDDRSGGTAGHFKRRRRGRHFRDRQRSNTEIYRPSPDNPVAGTGVDTSLSRIPVVGMGRNVVSRLLIWQYPRWNAAIRSRNFHLPFAKMVKGAKPQTSSLRSTKPHGSPFFSQVGRPWVQLPT